MTRYETRDPPRALLHPGFIGVGATLLVAAFVTDVIYYQTSLMQWANFSTWLIAGGLVVALVATLVLVVDFLIGRAGRILWLSFGAVAAAALLSLLNVFVHTRDGWTSVVPEGIGLSFIVTILLLIGAVRGWRVATARAADMGGRA
jgi:uncharacterized membrane protein